MTVSSALAVQRHTDREDFHLSASPAQGKKGGEIQASLSRRAFPGSIVLNRDGKIIYQSLGAQYIQKALAENNPLSFSKIVARFYAEIKQWMDRNGCRPEVLNPFVSRVFSLNRKRYLFRALPLYPQGDPSAIKHLLILFEPVFQ